MAIRVFDVIRGIRGGVGMNWLPGRLNALFGLILIGVYPAAPPVVISIVVCALIGGAVEIVVAWRLSGA